MKYIPKFQQGKHIIKVTPRKVVPKYPTWSTMSDYIDQVATIPIATNVIIKFEGFDKKAVKRAGDVWTIGSGLTAPKYVNKGTITPEENLEGVKEHIQTEVLPHIMSKPYWGKLSGPQKIALMNTVYNAGSGTFNTKMPKLQKALAKDPSTAAKELNFGMNQSQFPGNVIRGKFNQKLLSWKP